VFQLHDAETDDFIESLAWGHIVKSVDKNEDGTTRVEMVHPDQYDLHPVTLIFDKNDGLIRLRYKEYAGSAKIKHDLIYNDDTETFHDEVTKTDMDINVVFYIPVCMRARASR
jgi:hypothetical protein